MLGGAAGDGEGAGRRRGTLCRGDQGEKPSRAPSWERFGHLSIAGLFIKQSVLKTGDQLPKLG